MKTITCANCKIINECVNQKPETRVVNGKKVENKIWCMVNKEMEANK